MAFLTLAPEIIIFIIGLHLEDGRLICTDLPFSSDRLGGDVESCYELAPAEYPLCLSANAPEDRILSRQSAACVDYSHKLPRIFQLCHICSRIRTLVMGAPQLWARQALCWPARADIILQRAGACLLSFISKQGLCSCIFSDIKSFLHRSIEIELILPGVYLRADGAHLSMSALIVNEILRANQLTDLQLRFDVRRGPDGPSAPRIISIPSLRSARLQNAEFMPVGKALRVLHIAVEPRGPALSLPHFISALRACPNLQELALQNAIQGEYKLPWNAGLASGCPLVLESLKHLTCSGEQNLARALLYWISVSPVLDCHVDAEFRLGTTPDPFDRFSSELAAELCVLLHPTEVTAMMTYVRARAAAEDTGSPFVDVVPDLPPAPVLPYLALNVIPDTEVKDYYTAWPRLVTVAAAEDREGALRSVLAGCDPVYLGPGRMRRTFTMRNSYASFPNRTAALTRESFPTYMRPKHLGMAVSLPFTAYIRQADADDDVIYLALSRTSWVPQDERDWLFILAELPQLRTIEVLAAAHADCIRGLALYLWRERGNENLQEIEFQRTGMSSSVVQSLLEEVHALTVTRETADEEYHLPRIVWSLS
ncbi:hypothetical protein PENSPDRAFT_662513 [Peniophora sp. CONT]|nr:hypothetical protein PENSPDRAFT_662513 [Peniophora sp. CONT]